MRANPFRRCTALIGMEVSHSATDVEVNKIERFIKANYIDMYKKWKAFGGNEYYEG